jgi:uncharacterized membrane protein YfcA
VDSGFILAFLGLVALGSYIQTVSGFAIALIIAGGVTMLGLASIPFTANVISFIALANVAAAVHKRHGHIDIRIMLYGSLGVLLFSGAGLALLAHLSSDAVGLLEIMLGIVILASGALLMVHPHPLTRTSPAYAHLIAGGFGGLLSGLFGAGGPPLVVHIYRQPLPFTVIRTTLLAILGIMPLIRIAFESYNGNITAEILWLSALSAPVSIIVTLAAKRYHPPFSELVMRRFAFGLLCLIGISLIANRL